MKLNDIEFTVQELELVHGRIEDGEIVASMAVLAIAQRHLEAGETIDTMVLGDSVTKALGNVVSWWTDEHGNPVAVAQEVARLELI